MASSLWFGQEDDERVVGEKSGKYHGFDLAEGARGSPRGHRWEQAGKVNGHRTEEWNDQLPNCLSKIKSRCATKGLWQRRQNVGFAEPDLDLANDFHDPWAAVGEKVARIRGFEPIVEIRQIMCFRALFEPVAPVLNHYLTESTIINGITFVWRVFELDLESEGRYSLKTIKRALFPRRAHPRRILTRHQLVCQSKGVEETIM
ncbi:hypothetical protein FPV67DRAFT_1447809 [Lyophyllum atratum]|nr:hypothetical protein FPV67DRAFT_1447809 [Lyophyllum atratum]